MKALKLAALGVLAAGQAMAGAVTFVAAVAFPVPLSHDLDEIGAWIIPLVIVAVLALVLTQDNGNNNT